MSLYIKSHLYFENLIYTLKSRIAIKKFASILKTVLTKNPKTPFSLTTPLNLSSISKIRPFRAFLKNYPKTSTFVQRPSQFTSALKDSQSHPSNHTAPLPHNHHETLINPKKRLHRPSSQGFLPF